MRLAAALAVALALTVAAAVSFVQGEDGVVRAGDLQVSAAWARATPPGAKVGAAFLTVSNSGATPDRLVAAESPAATAIALHETVENAGVAQMRPLPDGIAIAPGGRVALQPGGFHMMLSDLQGPLVAGEQLEMTLVFERAGRIEVSAPIEPVGAPGPGSAEGHRH